MMYFFKCYLLFHPSYTCMLMELEMNTPEFTPGLQDFAHLWQQHVSGGSTEGKGERPSLGLSLMWTPREKEERGLIAHLEQPSWSFPQNRGRTEISHPALLPSPEQEELWLHKGGK
ncbi:unnamed protein product [Natator depressus]